MRMRLLILLQFCVTFIVAQSLSADDFSIMRENLRREVFLGPLDYDATDPDVQTYINTIVTNAATWQSSLQKSPTTCLWSDYPSLKNDVGSTCKHLYYSLQRLHTMSLAWAYPTSSLYHDSSLLYDITHSLDFLYGYCLNESTSLLGNFWEWRIGMPTEYAAIVSILYEQLTPTQLEHYDKSFTNFVRSFAKTGNLTYANQADICRNLLYMGILLSRSQDINDAISSVKRAFVDETTLAQRKKAQQLMEQMISAQGDYHNYNGINKKEGLYEDGTFIQHIAMPYIGGYGKSMALFASEMQLCFSGTSDYAAPSWFAGVIPTWIEKAYFPAVYKGEMMRMFMGRNVNSAHSSHEAARDLGLCLFNASELITDASERQHVIDVCSTWYTGNIYYNSIYEGLNPVIQKPQLERLLSAATGTVSDESFSKMQPAADRLIHQTKRFRFGLAMSSVRIGKFEGFSGNNMSGWYTGDGMTYIYTPNHREHWLSFFNRCNYYRMPGTTVDMISRAADGAGIALFDNPRNAQSHVGGLTLLNRYSMAAMSHVGAKSDLVAKKAWFAFDDEVVCLGAGISMSEQRLVETVVEQRNIDAAYFIDEEQGTTRKCYEMNYSNPTYAYINEVGGYVFPQPCTLSTYIEQNKCISFYLQHGKGPRDASYAYILLPQQTRDEVRAYAHALPLTILSNDTIVQSVWHRQLDIIGMNFYHAGTLSHLHSDGAAQVLFRHSGDTLHLSLCDPTWQRTSQQLVLEGVYTLISASPSDIVSVSHTATSTTITINASDRMGQSAELVLRTIQRMPEPLTDIENVQRNNVQCTKNIHDGQVYIVRGDRRYNVLGMEL